MPRRSGYPQGSGEVLERDRGSKSPVSFQPPPRGANKIYRSDTVFPTGEARKKIQNKTQLPLRSSNYISQSLPVEGGCSRSRSRTIFSGNGSLILVRNRTCTNEIHPHPPHKSFAELFQKRPSPRSPKLYPAISPRRRRMTEFSKLNSVSRSRTIYVGNGSLTLGRTRTCTNSTHPHPHIKVLRSFFKSDRPPVPSSPQ